MKIKYLSLLAAVMGASLSFGASINGQKAYYTQGKITYTGSNANTQAVSDDPVLAIQNNDNGKWTMALTISGLSATNTGETALLFTYKAGNRVVNAQGLGYQLTNDGALTLCAGGYNYGPTENEDYANSPWKAQTFSGYSKENPQPLTLFYSYNRGAVSISAMWGKDGELTTLSDLGKTSGVVFSSNVSQINFSAKDTTAGTAWNVPNGVTGEFTLNNFDVYTSVLTEEQMKEYAASAVAAVPEPAAASLGLLGLTALMMRRRRQA